MGTCIGKRNMSAFVTFNFSWLLWLLYAVFWITIAGPNVMKRHSGGGEDASSASNETHAFVNGTNSTEGDGGVWINATSFGG
mmetsp:Transcript_8581/g.11842  ORF Transcript_8581/g.11842 Transcript_8581/m.11842 type:complete len:82 (+) Transcript_8581:146-391(+)